jgi:hypothetical protein
VHADDAEWARKAGQVLTDTGAQDISAADEVRGDFANSERPRSRV